MTKLYEIETKITIFGITSSGSEWHLNKSNRALTKTNEATDLIEISWQWILSKENNAYTSEK